MLIELNTLPLANNTYLIYWFAIGKVKVK